MQIHYFTRLTRNLIFSPNRLQYQQREADKGYVGGGPSKFDQNMLKTLRASSLKLGSDKTEYVSQSKRDFVDNYQGPIKLYRGQDVRSGEAFKFGDESKSSIVV